MQDIQPASILSKAYEALKALVPMLDRLPKSQKFTFGDRLQNLLSDLLETLIEAHYSPRTERPALLKRANLMVEKIRFFTRLGHELGHFSTKQYEEMVRRNDEIGRMAGGWLRSLRE